MGSHQDCLRPESYLRSEHCADPRPIQRASCQGAILIAPAGNLTGGVGPLFPARFEAEAAPGAEECASLGSPRRADRPAAHSARLRGRSARSIRPTNGDRSARGNPRMAAYGQSVPSIQPGGLPYLLSGGSMSGAIATGVAAAVWTAQPDLTADRVMNIVYEGGVSVDPAHRDDLYSRQFPGYYFSTHTQTDFCLGHLSGPCADDVHRVFLCGALAKSSSRGGRVELRSTSFQRRATIGRVAPEDARGRPASLTMHQHRMWIFHRTERRSTTGRGHTAAGNLWLSGMLPLPAQPPRSLYPDLEFDCIRCTRPRMAG